MGYSTCGRHGARTCDACDSCPKCDGYTMHRITCPVNWCGLTTLCPTCHEKHGPVGHVDCRRHSARYKAEKARQESGGTVQDWTQPELIRQKPL